MIKKKLSLLIFTVVIISFQAKETSAGIDMLKSDSTKSVEISGLETVKTIKIEPITAQEITLTKDFAYTKYSLNDTYKYNQKDREFQWDKIKEHLAYVVNIQNGNNNYAMLSNYQNRNGLAPAVVKHKKNKYNSIEDTLGTDRNQSIPLYISGNQKKPIIYARDGSLVNILSTDSTNMVRIKGLSNIDGEWIVPKKYIKDLIDTITFRNIVIVDRTNQNICTIEQKSEKEWIIRSMNPSTTGKYAPPYGMKTPIGTFVVQEKKTKMYYLKDGTKDIEGFAPWAIRFTNGAYIHGVPVANPKGKIVDYRSSLGTIPSSHMCVRNASSHSKFIYDWVKPYSSLVIVID